MSQPANGTYEIAAAKDEHRHLVVDNKGGNIVEGNQIIIYDKNGSPAQKV